MLFYVRGRVRNFHGPRRIAVCSFARIVQLAHEREPLYIKRRDCRLAERAQFVHRPAHALEPNKLTDRELVERVNQLVRPFREKQENLERPAHFDGIGRHVALGPFGRRGFVVNQREGVCGAFVFFELGGIRLVDFGEGVARAVHFVFGRNRFVEIEERRQVAQDFRLQLEGHRRAVLCEQVGGVIGIEPRSRVFQKLFFEKFVRLFLRLVREFPPALGSVVFREFVEVRLLQKRHRKIRKFLQVLRPQRQQRDNRRNANAQKFCNAPRLHKNIQDIYVVGGLLTSFLYTQAGFYSANCRRRKPYGKTKKPPMRNRRRAYPICATVRRA